MSIQTTKPGRDHRIDALRGLALIMMYVDHIPEDLLNRFTMRNVGFADAAEIFVLLAGYASWLAYGRKIAKDGLWSVTKKILHRCWKIYLFQMGLVLISLLSIYQWRRFWVLPVDFLEPELAHGYSIARQIWRLLLLDALPSNLNILPLYIILLGIFPLLYLLIKCRWWLAIGLSFVVWLVVNINPWFNFPNWLDPDGWFFNPFAWQFLFTIGIYGAIIAGKHQGSFPAYLWLKWFLSLYLLFSFFEAFPWQYWGLPDLRILHVPVPAKAYLSPLRLLDVVAIFYLVQSSERAKRFSEGKVGQFLALYGRHSLEIFSLSTVFDLWGRLMFASWGTSLWLQLIVNCMGVSLLYCLALHLDKKRAKLKARLNTNIL
ncbi:OpgC family protein [Commensalibacter communis]|uniref:OpgC family protein n=1 Tax=Commensalibacter communis TaxID=2972786 RepID=UPI0022FF7FAE|nr:OpgC domain-containing protein [Commensalibacter communis]CAI3925928.1 Predicted acyltransferase (OpgC) [Commensalibacter communis]CAI3928763.1 Predicted acyltransferase (OpgC) [Commensalibacter communis]